ncbi:hypothetical protein U1Q18_007235, partial [Sarracenia purpurea var. burkii]
MDQRRIPIHQSVPRSETKNPDEDQAPKSSPNKQINSVTRQISLQIIRLLRRKKLEPPISAFTGSKPKPSFAPHRNPPKSHIDVKTNPDDAGVPLFLYNIGGRGKRHHRWGPSPPKSPL